MPAKENTDSRQGGKTDREKYLDVEGMEGLVGRLERGCPDWRPSDLKIFFYTFFTFPSLPLPEAHTHTELFIGKEDSTLPPGLNM